MAPADGLEAFWDKAGPIFESYKFNADAVKKNEGILNDLANGMLEELAKELAK